MQRRRMAPPLGPPRCFVNIVRFAVLSATVMMVPSIAHSSSPRQYTPDDRVAAAEPRSGSEQETQTV
jgi:hypothetical protein